MELSRRELIAAFLGSAVAASACRRSPPSRREVPGAIIDRAFAAGHKLRDGGPLPRPAELQRVDVAIVGGGAAGLSAAWRLASAGVRDLVVLEVDEALGGTARSGNNGVIAFPWGAHYLPAPLEATGPLSRLLSSVGALEGQDGEGRPIYAEQHLVGDPEERVFYRGHWYEGLYLRGGASPEDLAELERFNGLMNGFASARDGRGRKAFTVPHLSGSDDAEWTVLDKLSMAQWLEQEGFRSPRLRWWVDYGCRDDFGAKATEISAWAGIFYFSARQDGERRSAGVLTWPEGNGRLISELSRAVPRERQRMEVLVHTVSPTPAGVEVLAIGADGAPVGFLAREVVIASPRFVTRRIYAPWRTAAPDDGDTFAYAPWVVANLTLKSSPESRGYPLAWDNVLYESESLGYVVATHQLERMRDQGPTVWTWYYPCVGRDVVAERKRVQSATLQDWQALAMADLAPAHHGLAEVVERIDVFRHGHAMARPRPGSLFSPARVASRLDPEPRVHLAHSDLSGLPLFEEANHLGVLAAERVLSGLGVQASSWL